MQTNLSNKGIQINIMSDEWLNGIETISVVYLSKKLINIRNVRDYITNNIESEGYGYVKRGHGYYVGMLINNFNHPHDIIVQKYRTILKHLKKEGFLQYSK